MKPQWQQQQQQMRRRQEQLRQQQMGAAWLEQQKARAEKARPDALPEQKGKDKFAQIETEVSRLRQEVAAGRLSEEQFKARLRELMVQDEQGNWWMLGYETGEWYLHDGADWVRADPPGRVALRAASVAPAKLKPRRFWGIVVFLLGLVVTFGFGVGMAVVAFEILEMGRGSDLIAGIIGWLGGLILTIVITRKVWRRK